MSVPAAERYILDTSAVLALTDQEDGFEKVEELAIIAEVAAVDVKAVRRRLGSAEGRLYRP